MFKCIFALRQLSGRIFSLVMSSASISYFMLCKLYCIISSSLPWLSALFLFVQVLQFLLEVMWYARYSTQSSWCPRQHRLLSKCTGSYVACKACCWGLERYTRYTCKVCKACWKDIQSVGAVAMGWKSMTWRNWKDWSRLYWDGRRCDFCVSCWTRHILLVAST